MRRAVLLACLAPAAACGGAEAPRGLPPATGPALPAAQPLGAPLALGRDHRLHERDGLALRDPGVRLRGHPWAWATAPDRRAVAVSVSTQGRVQVVRTGPLRGGPLTETHAGGVLIALAWPARDRVLGITGLEPDIPSRLVDVDPWAGRERRERTLAGHAVTAQGSPLGLVAVLGGTTRTQEARLLHADPRGRVRVHRLPGVAASWSWQERKVPGLAVSVRDARAFVVAPTRALRIVEVDLRTGRTTTNEVGEPRPLLARVRDLVEPPAEAKTGRTATRVALWLGGGRLAVSGADEDTSRATGPRQRRVGLRIVDVRRWRQQLVDRDAAYAVRAGDLLLAGWGVPDRFGIRIDHMGRGGLRAYGLDGRHRWTTRADRALTPRYEHDGTLHAYDWRAERLVPVDLATGRAGAPLRPARVPVSLSSLP